MTNRFRDITKQEWEEYEWEPTDNKRIWLRGIKKTEPPDDGFVYVECTTISDTEQKWMRAQTYAD